MFIEIDFFTKPLATIWQFFMADKPQILRVILRKDPESGGTEPPDGASYTVRLSNGTVREVFQPHGYEAVNYNDMRFVRPEAEGDNFYKFRRSERFTTEPVPQTVKDAVCIDDDNSGSAPKNAADERPEGHYGQVRPTGLIH
jgi:hypothetical protein